MIHQQLTPILNHYSLTSQNYLPALSMNTSLHLENDEYAQRKNFESQPGYIFGKLLRQSALNIQSYLTGSIDYIKHFKEDAQERFNAAYESWTHKNTTQTRALDQLEQEIVQHYHLFSNNLDMAIKKAQTTNKPLMILIGENHISLQSAVAEILILDIASKKMSLQAVLTEASFAEYYKKSIQISNNAFEEYPFQIAEDKIHALGLKKIPIDYGICEYKTEKNRFPRVPADQRWIAIREKGECSIHVAEECTQDRQYPDIHDPISELGVEIRDTVMVDVVVEADVNETIAIVGGAHLYGMVKKTDLQKHYHVLPINTAPINPVTKFEKEVTYSRNAQKVLQIHPNLYPANKYFCTQEILNKVHETLAKLENLQITNKYKPK